MVALMTPQQNSIPTKSNEWYTPSKYVEAAREVMGGVIDLDPASCAMANETVKAKRYYSKEDDGLSKSWYGNVWLNPPFGKEGNKSILGMFVAKLIDDYCSGSIQEAILLSTARTDNRQLLRIWDYPICFTDHVVRFAAPIARDNSWDGRYTHMHGTIFVYLGSNEQRFIDTFSQFGRIAKAIDTSKQIPAPTSLWEVQ